MAKTVQLSPTQQFEGDDGSWSTFYIMVGDDVQRYRILPATSQGATWVIAGEACDEDILGNYAIPSNCTDLRGSTLDRNLTSNNIARVQSGSSPGFHLPYTSAELDVDSNIYNGSGYGGYGAIVLGNDPSDLTVDDQALAISVDKYPFFGLLGLSSRSTQMTNGLSYQSILTTLKAANETLSRYWAYHAGRAYAEPPMYGSVIFGGYDSLRGDPKAFEVPFYEEDVREFLVTIPQITISTPSSPDNHILANQTLNAMIDSMIPEIWLPTYMCEAIQDVFGLTWNNTYRKYLLSDDQRRNLLELNPNITFALAVNSSAPQSQWMNITLPYAAFDLSVSLSLQGFTKNYEMTEYYYFPLERADSDDQYVLGRTFLQEAYMTADYDERVFSISPATSSRSSNITQVPPESTPSSNNGTTATPPENSSSGLAVSAIAGVVVGSVVAVVAALALSYWFCWRPRKRNNQQPKKTREESVATFQTPDTSTLFAPEDEYSRSQSIGIAPGYWAGTDHKIGSEQKEKQELDATFTARARGASGATERHELPAGSVRHPSTGRGSISPMAERRPGHERVPSDTPSFGVSTLQSLSGPHSPPIAGHPSPPLGHYRYASPPLGRPSPPLSDSERWFGPLYELQGVPRSVPEELPATEIPPCIESSDNIVPEVSSVENVAPDTVSPPGNENAEDTPRESITVSEVTSECDVTSDARKEISDQAETPVIEHGPDARLL